VRIVGEVFALQQVLLTDNASLAGLDAYIVPQSVQFNIDLTPGTSQQSYLDSLDAALLRYGITAQPHSAQVSSTLISMESLAAMLTLMLLAVAGAGAIGVPIGIALHDSVLPAMGHAAGTTIPAADLAVYHLPVVIALMLGGLIIATAGAVLPAGWAARTRTATALRTE
jgi:putative ABC transport system permease protein